LRLFIAVEIEDEGVLRKIIEFRDAVLACSRGSRGMKGVEDENIHITIRFIGEVPETLLSDIKACVERASRVPRFKVRVKGIGAFPNLSRPRVIWVAIEEGSEGLKELHRAIEPCIRSFAKPERGEYIPHITVARVKGGIDRLCLAKVMEEFKNEDFGSFTVTNVRLKRSVLRPSGPIYSDLHKVSLANEREGSNTSRS